MVRMTLELGKQPPNIAEVPVIEKEIDIQHGGQLVESFMCEVNRLGTVCLTLPSQPYQEANHNEGSCIHTSQTSWCSNHRKLRYHAADTPAILPSSLPEGTPA
jgi:hypothetical protein